MIGMGETYADGHGLERVKNTSPTLPTYTPARTVEDVEEDDRILEIAKKVGLTEGETMTEGIPKKVMIELSSYYDPISVWISRKKKNQETFY